MRTTLLKRVPGVVERARETRFLTPSRAGTNTPSHETDGLFPLTQTRSTRFSTTSARCVSPCCSPRRP